MCIILARNSQFTATQLTARTKIAKTKSEASILLKHLYQLKTFETKISAKNKIKNKKQNAFPFHASVKIKLYQLSKLVSIFSGHIQPDTT